MRQENGLNQRGGLFWKSRWKKEKISERKDKEEEAVKMRTRTLSNGLRDDRRVRRVRRQRVKEAREETKRGEKQRGRGTQRKEPGQRSEKKAMGIGVCKGVWVPPGGWD